MFTWLNQRAIEFVKWLGYHVCEEYDPWQCVRLPTYSILLPSGIKTEIGYRLLWSRRCHQCGREYISYEEPAEYPIPEEIDYTP